jgi:hypothetical protein
MIVNSLEEMEVIVSNNKTLSWDGWNVVELIKSPGAWGKPSGVFFKGSWYYKNTFVVTEAGWSIPNKYVR